MKHIGSFSSGPMYVTIHYAYADLSSKPANNKCNFSWVIDSKNHLIYGPGRPFNALKHNDVSSQINGAFTSLKASIHFSFAISIPSYLPYNSGKSTDLFSI